MLNEALRDGASYTEILALLAACGYAGFTKRNVAQ